MQQIYLFFIALISIYIAFTHPAPRIDISQSFQHMRTQNHKQIRGEPLRILFVVENFPLFDQPFILDQIVALLDRGHDIYIAAKHNTHGTVIPDVAHYNLTNRTLFFGRSNPLELLTHHATIPHINTFDVIYCQFGNIGADVIRYRSAVGYIPAQLVTCWRGAIKEVTMHPSIYATLFQQGDLFMPVCEFLKKELINLGCNANKIHVMYVGIMYTSYPHERPVQKDIINCVSVCRLVEKKGIEYAIRAIADVVKADTNIHYTIVGDGQLKEDLISLVKELGVKKYITFMGNQPHDAIPQFLHNADIFLSPSITAVDGNHEGIANSLKEAMASGALAIATDHAGTNELIQDGISGFLVPERDSHALADTIRYLIAHPEIWNTMRLFGQQIIQERFCLAKNIDQFIAIIEKICIR